MRIEIESLTKQLETLFDYYGFKLSYTYSFDVPGGDSFTRLMYNMTSAGLTDTKNKTTQIKAYLDPENKLRTLAHELGHVVLHKGMRFTEDVRPVLEIEAESFAFLLLLGFGLDYREISESYIQMFMSKPLYNKNPYTEKNFKRVAKGVADAYRQLVNPKRKPFWRRWS